MSTTVTANVDVLHKVPNFVSDLASLNGEKLVELIKRHSTYLSRYKLLNDYYIGKHAIRQRELDADKPNNKLVDGFCEYITNIKTGYFMGTPVTYKSKQKTKLKQLQDVYDDNDEKDVNNELARLSSIYGHAFELNYIDSDGEYRFVAIKPSELIGIYDGSVANKLIAGVRYIITHETEGEKYYQVEVYSADEIVTYKGTLTDGLIESDRKSNPLPLVPVIEYKNNADRLGDFENVITLVDAYEIVQSDSTNEVQYFNDAYLVLKGLDATDDQDVKDMKNNRVIKLDGEEGDAEWLVKNINDGHIQNLLKNIKSDIHKFAKTPDLNDEAFASNLSGVAIKYKLWTLEQDISNKERKFTQALKTRIKLIFGYFKTLKGGTYDHKVVGLDFTRNIPMNDLENAQMVTLLAGLVSNQTRLGLLNVIDNPADEQKLVEKEKEAEAVSLGFSEPSRDINPTQQQNQEQELQNLD